jgi:hypothetical protein
MPSALFRNRQFAEVIRRQPGCQMDVFRDGRWFDPEEVFRIHSVDEVLHDVGGDILTEWGDGYQD